MLHLLLTELHYSVQNIFYLLKQLLVILYQFSIRIAVIHHTQSYLCIIT